MGNYDARWYALPNDCYATAIQLSETRIQVDFSFIHNFWYRMEAPHNCPEEIYRIMMACWQERRENRPPFTTIVTFMEWMLSDEETSDGDVGNIHFLSNLGYI